MATSRGEKNEKNSLAGKQIHTFLRRGGGTIKLLVRIYSPAKSLRQNRHFIFQFPLFCQPYLYLQLILKIQKHTLQYSQQATPKNMLTFFTLPAGNIPIVPITLGKSFKRILETSSWLTPFKNRPTMTQHNITYT